MSDVGLTKLARHLHALTEVILLLRQASPTTRPVQQIGLYPWSIQTVCKWLLLGHSVCRDEIWLQGLRLTVNIKFLLVKLRTNFAQILSVNDSR
jgi:hypothetical protein